MQKIQTDRRVSSSKTTTAKLKIKKFFDSDQVSGLIFSSPFIIGFLGITLIPLLFSLYYSFTNFNLVKGDWVGFTNYINLAKDVRFFNSIRATLIYVVVSVPFKLAFALFVAFLLTRKIRGVSLYRTIYYVPSLIGGSIAVALVWKELFSSDGLINTLLSSIGARQLSWFGDPKLAMIPLILMSVWQFGSSMIIFAAGIQEIPKDYYEAATLDGSSKIHTFFKITLPLLSPIILYNLIMQTISAFMTFTQAFVITQGGPNDATNFYALYLYNQAFKYYQMGPASAMSWVMLIIMVIVTAIIFKSSKRWVTYDR